jgi:hypothetical protein
VRTCERMSVCAHLGVHIHASICTYATGMSARIRACTCSIICASVCVYPQASKCFRTCMRCGDRRVQRHALMGVCARVRECSVAWICVCARMLGGLDMRMCAYVRVGVRMLAFSSMHYAICIMHYALCIVVCSCLSSCARRRPHLQDTGLNA